MKWIGKDPPLYIYLDDFWERKKDHKLFKADQDKKGWIADDGEVVYWPKKARVMTWRENK